MRSYNKIKESDLRLRNIIPSSLVREHKLFPLSINDGVLKVATPHVMNPFVIQDLEFTTGLKINEVIYPEKLIEDAFIKFYTSSHNKIVDPSVIRNTDEILKSSVKKRASDIHIETYKERMRVRYRIDGILYEEKDFPINMGEMIIARIKIMSSMRIDEKRLPQDGRIGMKIDKKLVEFRVSTMPGLKGEKVGIRVLDRSQGQFELNSIGYEETQKNIFIKALNKGGITLVTGPTGAGKTTTLYATLKYLKREDVNITTVEDPVEYTIYGVNQIEVRELIGLTFANLLRSILRQDPDIIMIGEIRDRETCEIAIRAALTGHIVLSTVHTGSASESIIRLIDLGIKPFLLSETLSLIQSQSLVKKICPHCREKDEENPEYFKGKGCSQCNFTGYLERTGIFEVMKISSKIRELIVSGDSSSMIREMAKTEGMQTLRDSAFIKLKKGIIDLNEALKYEYTE